MATSEEVFVRTELAERLIASLADDVSPEITEAPLPEVRRRIAQVESGEAELIPGDEALARVRNLLSNHLPSRLAHYTVAPLPSPALSFVHEHHR